MQKHCFAVLILAAICCRPAGVAAQDAPDDGPIREAVDSYVNAFNARDAAALAKHWSPQGVYISRTSGERVTGRESVEQEFTQIFAGDNLPTLAVTTDSIRFISPNVALERGTAVVHGSDDSVSTTNYSVVYINHEGEWLIDRVTEDDVISQASNYDHLQGLQFLIGDWVDAGPAVTIRTSCQWTRNQNYISRRYTVEENGESVSSGLQIIGWDAHHEEVRSWLFDSSGTFVQGTWSENNGRWMNQSVASLADGGRGSFTAVFRPIDDNSYGWRKVDRIIDGRLLPSVDEVIVERE